MSIVDLRDGDTAAEAQIVVCLPRSRGGGYMRVRRGIKALIPILQWLFTTGLSISASVDLITAVSLCFYLQKRRTGFSRYVASRIPVLRILNTCVASMDYIIDTIMVYTVETGMLTSIATIASFICVCSFAALYGTPYSQSE